VRGCAVLLASLSLAAAWSGCAINPVTGRPEIVFTTAAREREIGREEAEKVERHIGFVEEGEVPAYVRAIGERLAEHSPRRDVEYHFYVVEMLEPNAFALPGGYVFVSRGLVALANSEDELAGVLGHEIGHVAARHAVKRESLGAPFEIATGLGALATSIVSPFLGRVVGEVGRFASGLVLAPYSREQEREADRVGQQIAAASGWDPQALAAVLKTLEREEELRREGRPRGIGFLSSHPSFPERVADASAHARKLEPAVRDPIAQGRSGFLRRIDGLGVGADPGEGIFVDGVFLHPDLDFRLRFPEDWRTQNARSYVAGGAPDGETFAVLEVAGEGTDPVAAARRFAEERGVRLLEEPSPLRIGSLAAARSSARFRRSALDLTWIAHGSRVYQLTGVCPPVAFEARRETFAEMAQSFRPLTAEERAGILETRLRVVRSSGAETLAELVERTRSVWSAEEVAVANGLEIGAAPREGDRVKIAIREPYGR
jgi:predicted Zn-dependent protease